MYSPLQMAARYMSYWWNASNGKGHGVHSPFVYSLIREVLQNQQKHPSFSRIEQQRALLLKDKRKLSMVDFGAGSRLGQKAFKEVGDIASHSLKPPKYARLLHRLATFLEAGQILELGTSLGITTAYLAAADSTETVHTMEGNPDVAQCASDTLSTLGLIDKTVLHIGDFDQLLPEWIQQRNGKSLDLVYLDGNHRYKPTMQYANLLLPLLSEKGVIVFDDIHWSAEMEQAWAEVVADKRFTCTIDLFFIGLAFIDPAFLKKQHFLIKH